MPSAALRTLSSRELSIIKSATRIREWEGMQMANRLVWM